MKQAKVNFLALWRCLFSQVQGYMNVYFSWQERKKEPKRKNKLSALVGNILCCDIDRSQKQFQGTFRLHVSFSFLKCRNGSGRKNVMSMPELFLARSPGRVWKNGGISNILLPKDKTFPLITWKEQAICLQKLQAVVITLSLLNFLKEYLIAKRTLTTLISLRCTGNVHA